MDKVTVDGHEVYGNISVREFSGDLPEFLTICGHPDYAAEGTKMVSKFTIDSDWPVYLMIEVVDWLDATGDEDKPEWVVILSAVAPEAVSEENMKRAFDCCGFDLADLEEESEEDALYMTLEALHSYGIKAPIGEFWCNEPDPAVKVAMREAVAVRGLFGFFMDRQVNAIGNTGWHFLQGEIGF